MKNKSWGLGTRAACILAFCACVSASHALQPLGNFTSVDGRGKQELWEQ